MLCSLIDINFTPTEWNMSLDQMKATKKDRGRKRVLVSRSHRDKKR